MCNLIVHNDEEMLKTIQGLIEEYEEAVPVYKLAINLKDSWHPFVKKYPALSGYVKAKKEFCKCDNHIRYYTGFHSFVWRADAVDYSKYFVGMSSRKVIKCFIHPFWITSVGSEIVCRFERNEKKLPGYVEFSHRKARVIVTEAIFAPQYPETEASIGDYKKCIEGLKEKEEALEMIKCCR